MANSTITLYRVGFRPETNPCLDSISTYLASLTPVLTINNFQFVKHALDLTIKCEIYQDELASPSMNYVSIKNDIDSRTYYYYVRNVYWRSQNTLLLDLSMDTLNTFKDLILFTDNTVVKREHKDRFIKPTTVPTTTFTAKRIVDKIDEGLTGLVKYVGTKTSFGLSNKWYLVYCSNQGLNVGDTNSNDAINCYLVPENDITVSAGETGYNGHDITTANSTYRIFTADNVTINIDGVDYTNTPTRHYGFGRYTTDTSGFVVYIAGTTVTRVAYNIDLANPITFSANTGATALLTPDSSNTWSLPIYDALDKNYTAYTSGGTYTIKSIENVNRTLSYLVKIIECPYPPLDITTAVSDGTLSPIYTKELNSNGIYVLKLAKLEAEFNYKVSNNYVLTDFNCENIPASVDRPNTTKNMRYESKLWNSSIHSEIMTYDSFTLELPYEEFSATESNAPSLEIYYKQSNAINSALYFDFQMHQGTWTKTGALENILVCDRNNEYPIYNSSYLDYIRTGYNFDKKAKNLQLGQGLLSTALNIGGSALSFGLTGATKGISAVSGVSMLTSGIDSISNNIFSNINLRNQIEQKKAQAKATASSVQASDDLNLLNGYLGNKLFSFTYFVPINIRYKVFELFYLTGYASERTGVPDITSRKNFNFLECEAEFSTRDNPEWKNFIEDVKERFRLGVTFFHKYDDFLQEKENWESWL